jgi:regulatory protein
MKRPRQLSAEELFAWSVKKLEGRASSVGELRSSLLSRALETSDVEGVLSRLKDYGYLNDARFAESFASARLENEGLGKTRVLRDLRRRRVAPDLAQRTVSGIYADKDEPALIEQYIRRKYRSIEREGLFQSNKELAAAYARLLRAGFTPGIALTVLKRFAAHPELLDQLEDVPVEPEEEGHE